MRGSFLVLCSISQPISCHKVLWAFGFYFVFSILEYTDGATCG